MMPASSTLPSPIPAPNLASTFELADYFQPVAWFYHSYGCLPRQQHYQLSQTESRQQILQVLAQQHDLSAITIAHSEYLEKVGEEPGIRMYALLLAPQVLLYFSNNGAYTDRGAHLLYSPETDKEVLQQTRAMLAEFLETGQQERQRINVLRLDYGALEFMPLTIKLPDLNLATHYNDDLPAAHDVIVQRLQKPQDKGIVILYGPPGTGKTNYIRHLCALTDKPKLFIPPNLAARIADPDFVNLLHDNTNSILIIEDAEDLLLKRDGQGANTVSNLLNLSDGLLADCFHIQIICTFNTDLSRIDSALLRKGRLIAAYEFAALATEKAQALAISLNPAATVTKPTTLADLYNQETTPFNDLSAPSHIGFGNSRR